MNIQENYSTFNFRPLGVLKSSVSTTPHLRFPLIPAFDQQNLLPLSEKIDPTANNPLDSLKYINTGMLFLSMLENVYLLVQEGMDGVILTEDFHPIQESLYYCKNPSITAQDIPSLENIQTLDEVFLPFDSQWTRYHHWMGYTLSKAYLANLYIPSTIQIVIPYYRENDHFTKNSISQHLYNESLEKTRLKSRVTFLENGIYKIKKLSYFQPNSHLPHSYFNFNDAKQVFSFLNKNIKYRDTLPARFMIAQDTNMEPVISNAYQNAFERICQTMDIPIVYLKNMDWSTQISLFSQAEFIISPHRPELVNLYFCQNDTKILELTRSGQDNKHLSAWPFMIASTNKIYYSFLNVDSGLPDPYLIENAIHNLNAY